MGGSMTRSGNGLAIDMGTANTLIHRQGEGVVLNEPSVVALNRANGRVVAVGATAKSYIGRTPENIKTVCPLERGVITDYKAAHEMIRQYLGRVSKKGLFSKPTLIICIPSSITPLEKRAISDAAKESGAGRICLMEGMMATAIGAGMDISTPEGKLIIDMGGGTTDMALISMSSVMVKESITVAGKEIDRCIMDFIEKKHDLVVGPNKAEEVKLTIGGAMPQSDPRIMEVHGKGLRDGTPRKVVLIESEIQEAIQEPLKEIETALMGVIGSLPPEFIDDVGEAGIMLAGGSALLPGIADRLSSVCTFKVRVDAEPLLTTVRGAGIVLDNLKDYQEIIIS